MYFAVLGPLEIRDSSASIPVGGVKERLLLARLVAGAPGVVPADSLVDGLWGGAPPRTATKTLQAYVVHLRRALEPARVVVTQASGYRLAVRAEDIDALVFADLVTRARAAVRDDPVTAERLAGDALQLWRGTPYAEFPGADFARVEAARLGELRITALEIGHDAGLALGSHAELVAELEAVCGEYPFHERFWEQLIVALYRCGRQADALAAYRRARLRLVAEIGVEPGSGLRRLEQRVLEQDPALDAPMSIRTPLPAPLDAAGQRLAGREDEVAWLQAAWSAALAGRGGLVVIAGPQGSGRTRLAAAVAGDAHAGGATVEYVRGDYGGDALGRVLAQESSRPLLLVVDDLHVVAEPAQLELSAIAESVAARHVLVIATYDPAQASGALRAELLRSRHEERLLGPLDPAAVGEVVAWYAPTAAEELVEQVRVLSGGWPAAVHDTAARLVRERAVARVGVAAGRAVRARQQLAEVRADLRAGVNEVTRTQRLRTAQHATGTPIRCPYKGLSGYVEGDAELYHGREAQVTALCARLVDTPFVAVIGPSGSGKSSLLRAGLLPAVAEGVVPGLGRLPRVVLTPGADPLAALNAAIPDGPAVVVVDQFEEIFTSGATTAERASFVDALIAMAAQDRSRVVLALRGDYVGACGEHAALAERLSEGAVLVTPLTADEVRQVVELPARQVGLDVEPALVEEVVADVAGQPAALPLLSTALVQVWERRRDTTLTAAAYQRVGGVAGALTRLAESAYQQLDDAGRKAARRLMLRLADVRDAGTAVRRRAQAGELLRDADTKHAFAVLVDRRLIMVGDRGVELTHDALLTEWPRLARWLEEDAQGRTLRRHLSPAALEWQEAGRPDTELYRGARLATAVDWAADHADELTVIEHAFLEAGRALADRELAQQRDRAEREARGRRRLLAALVALGLLLVLTVIASSIAINQRGAAQDAERRAEARRLGARALIEPDLDRSLLLAAQAIRTDHSLETEGDLLSVLARSPAAVGQVRGDGDRLLALDLGQDGRTLVAGDNNGTVSIWEAGTLRPIGQPLQVGNWSPTLALAPDSRTLAVDDGRDLALWDLQLRVRIRSLGQIPGRTGPVIIAPVMLAWTTDGQRLAAAFPDGFLRIYEFGTGRLVSQVAVGGAAAVAQAGPYLVVAALHGREVLVVNPASGQVVRRLPVSVPVNALSGSADGAHIAVGGDDGTLVLVDLAGEGNIHAPISAHATTIRGIAFSPDAKLVATMSDDRDAAVWSVADGQQRTVLLGHTGRVLSGVFARDSDTLYTGSLDGTVIAWDVTGQRTFGRRASAGTEPFAEPFWYLGWSADARRAVVAEAAGMVRLVDTSSGQVRSIGPVAGPNASAARVSADGSSAFISGSDGRFVRVDLDTTRVVGTAQIPGDQLLVDIGLAPDGTRAALFTESWPNGAAQPTDGRILVLDAATLRVLDGPWALRSPGGLPAFSLDGQSVVFASAIEGDGRVSLWDVRTHAVKWTADLDTADVTAYPTFSPDGRTVAFGTRDGNVVLLDTQQGRRVAGPVLAQPGIVASVGYRPDGRVILTSGQDGTLGLWDADHLRRIGRPLVVADSRLVYATFSADGKRLVAFDGLGRSATWNAQPADWLARACAIVGRDFTPEEWAEYVPDRPYRHTCA